MIDKHCGNCKYSWSYGGYSYFCENRESQRWFEKVSGCDYCERWED